MSTIAGMISLPDHSRARFPGTFFWTAGVIFPVLLGLIFLSERPAANAAGSGQQTFAAANTSDSLVTVTLTFVGDLMCHSPQFNNARKADGSYDFNPSFAQVKPYFEASDFVIGNLETTCAGSARGFSGYPAFNSPDEYVAALKNAGFDMLATSNNHSMDTGEEGLQRTIDVIKKNGLAYTGTFTSKNDRDSVRIMDLKGMKIAVLNYTYGTNGAYPSKDHAYMLNVFDSTLVKKDIASAKKQGAELVLVFYHWGTEYRPDPMWPKQDTMMRTTIASGADLIIGSHPHVVGPVTYYKTVQAKLDSGLVAWTMGNFISNQSGRYKDAGLILTIELTKNLNTGEVRISKTSFMPTWVYRGLDPANKNYVVLPADWCTRDSLPSWISADSKSKMCEAFGDTRKMATRYSSRPQLSTTVSSGRRRAIVSRPQMQYTYQEEGTVPVSVLIDREGRVIRSDAGTDSSAVNPVLRSMARQQAAAVRFDSCGSCPAQMQQQLFIDFKPGSEIKIRVAE